MKEITSTEAFREATKSGKVVAEFYATWCPDCTRIEPYFPEWEEAYKNEFTMIRGNRDELPELAEELQILGIPTFVVFEDGREVNRLYSRDAKSKQQVQDFLNTAYQK